MLLSDQDERRQEVIAFVAGFFSEGIYVERNR